MRYPKGRRAPKMKEGDRKIVVVYNRPAGDEAALQYFWHINPDIDHPGRRDTPILMEAFESPLRLTGKSLKDELIARGYDISTFKFTIEKLKP